MLVTGITSDIGMAIATAFAREGAQILATGRTVTQETRLLPEGCTGWFAGGDLCLPRTMKRLLELLPLRAKIYSVVNVTGGWHSESEAYWSKEAREFSPEVYAEAFASGPTALQNVLALCLPRMSEGGSIINMSADLLPEHVRICAPYWLACRLINNFTRAHASFLYTSPRRFRMNCVAPSWVDTRALRRFLPEHAGRERLLSPDDVAQVVLDLADPACERNGEIVPILPRQG